MKEMIKEERKRVGGKMRDPGNEVDIMPAFFQTF